MTYKVIQWATGSVGRASLRAIIEHPELELVGVLVFDPAKAGMDAGALCGLPDTGIAATTDAADLLKMDAHCVSHSPRNTKETTEEVAAILETGKSVVTSALLPALYAPAKHVSHRSTDRLEQACRTGESSLFVSGIDPGFATDALAVFLTGISGRVDHVRMIEIFSYEHYDDADTQFRWFGFGQPLDSPIPPYMAPGRLTRYWGPTVELVAAGLGLEIDEMRETTDRIATTTPLTVDAGTIDAGTVGGLRFEVNGYSGGRNVVTLEHVTRLHPSVAPEWPQPTVPDGCYRIIISGWPNYELNLHASDENGNQFLGMEAATGTRLVNNIGRVCDAQPGILSPFDLGLVKNTGLVRR
ncbi:MAG: dihydrodipicolinate reductase, N-terminus protein [Acidimicrobiia bacterium]|nr:dihydrodipicolinate reductase, N-terminus protein [Acidimicrobiia bacterium]